MGRKKLSEMTPWERVEQRLEGLTNEEAADIAARIMGQIVAKRHFINNDLKEYMKGWRDKMIDYAIEFGEEQSMSIALARSVQKMESKEKC